MRSPRVLRNNFFIPDDQNLTQIIHFSGLLLTTSADWAARRLQAKNDQIRKLENRITGYQLQLLQSRQKIQDWTTQLNERLRSESTIKLSLSLRDYVFWCYLKLKSPKNGRRYFPETLEWAWAIQQQSRTAWKLVRKGLHLLCESLVDAHFAHAGAVLSQALLDLDRVGEVISLWDRSRPRTATDRRVVLSVDAVPFRPRVAIGDDLSGEGLDDLNGLENREVFKQFLLHPK
jgi:hypothetical protein